MIESEIQIYEIIETVHKANKELLFTMPQYRSYRLPIKTTQKSI